MVATTELYNFIQVSVTLIVIQGHNVQESKSKIFSTHYPANILIDFFEYAVLPWPAELMKLRLYYSFHSIHTEGSVPYLGDFENFTFDTGLRSDLSKEVP